MQKIWNTTFISHYSY